MSTFTPAPPGDQRTLFAELTGMLREMKHSSYEQVEAAVEERFRAFLRSHGDVTNGTLEIRLSWSLPEGPDSWALYGCEFRALPAVSIEHDDDRVNVDNVIPFPDLHSLRLAAGIA